MLMPLIKTQRGRLSIRQACAALGLAPSTYHRWQRPPQPKSKRAHPRALTALEREQVLSTLHAPRFVDRTPAHVVATLLDEQCYLCSARTMYRILSAHAEVKERRAQAQRRRYARPELCADRPKTLWSWDISRLPLVGGGHVNLYAIEDVYSRYVVGWMVEKKESAALSCELVQKTLERQAIVPGQLTLHADRGSVMTSDPLTALLQRRGVRQTHSRPRISDDNPFSEALFKTLKYHAGFPGRFADCEEARAYCAAFFAWYNAEHKHSGLGYLSPAQVHLGQAEQHRAARATTLGHAFARHPERFVKGCPVPHKLPTVVWINPPLSAPGTQAPTSKEDLQ